MKIPVRQWMEGFIVLASERRILHVNWYKPYEITIHVSLALKLQLRDPKRVGR